MRLVKVRRVGNSNVVTIPREFEARGFAPGASVLVEESREAGELRIVPIEWLRERLRESDTRDSTELQDLMDLFGDPPKAS